MKLSPCKADLTSPTRHVSLAPHCAGQSRDKLYGKHAHFMDVLIEAYLLMKYNCRLNRLSLYLAQRNRSTTSSYQHVFEDVLVTGEKCSTGH